MRSQVIGRDRVALYIEEKEFGDHGLNTSSVGANELKSLVTRVFKSSGCQVRGDMEIEVYDSDGGIMVFAHIGKLFGCERFFFDDIEPLLSAVQGMNGFPYRSRLTYYGGGYILEINDLIAELRPVSMRLSEFGERSAYPAELVREYGAIIIEDRALENLQTVVNI